jgi:transposase-like protein
MASQITHHRHKLVAAYYGHFRALIAEKNLRAARVDPVGTYIEILRTPPREKSWCVWCESKMRSAAAGGKTPVFGVQFRNSGEINLDPLSDADSQQHFQRILSREEAPGCREGYAGFVCCGKFHRFEENKRAKEHAEQLWMWIRERVRTHHGLWKRNATSYLKELEWKYNNRFLDPDLQAKKFIELMPKDFLKLWSEKEEVPE